MQWSRQFPRPFEEPLEGGRRETIDATDGVMVAMLALAAATSAIATVQLV